MIRSTSFVGLLLFTVVVAVYLLTFGGRFYSIDEEIHLRMTQSLVAGNILMPIAPIEYAPQFSVARGLDGQMYANRNPGLPVISVPLYILGQALAGLGSPHVSPSPDGMAQPSTFTLALTLANTLLMAATVLVVFLTIIQLGYGRGVAAMLALLLAFGTMAWAYASKSFFAEPLLAFCTVMAFLLALRYRQHGHLLLLIAAGGLAGLAIATKVTAFALAPFLAAYVIWPAPGTNWRWSTACSRLACLAAAIAPFILILMLYNAMRFGSPVLTGYELEGGGKSLIVENAGQFLTGLYGLTLSAGKGLLIFAAPLLLGLWAAPHFRRAQPAESVFIYGLGVVTIVGTALWRDWTGGWCWGPRLVLNVVPLLLIPAAALLSLPYGRSRRVWWFAAGLGLLSVCVQLVGVLPNYLNSYMSADHTLVHFSPMSSPLAGNWLALASGKVDLFWNNVEIYFPQHAASFTSIRLAVLVVGLVAVLCLWWLIGTDQRSAWRRLDLSRPSVAERVRNQAGEATSSD